MKTCIAGVTLGREITVRCAPSGKSEGSFVAPAERFEQNVDIGVPRSICYRLEATAISANSSTHSGLVRRACWGPFNNVVCPRGGISCNLQPPLMMTKIKKIVVVDVAYVKLVCDDEATVQCFVL